MAKRARTSRQRTGRVKRRRRRVVVYVFELLLGFALLGGVAYAFTHYVRESPRFQVKRVRVEGADFLREERILAVAGVTSADNLLFFDAAAVRQRVEAMPYVKWCEVQRAYPDMVVIRLEERMAEATLLANNHTFEVDGEGVVLRELESFSNYCDPLITEVPELGFVAVGQKLEQEELHRAMDLWRAFRRVPLAEVLTISEIAAPEAERLSTFFDELPFEVIWGRCDFVRQAERFDILWGMQEGQLPCAEYLDLRFENNLVCR